MPHTQDILLTLRELSAVLALIVAIGLAIAVATVLIGVAP